VDVQYDVCEEGYLIELDIRIRASDIGPKRAEPEIGME
jgi:hypothetical protein